MPKALTKLLSLTLALLMGLAMPLCCCAAQAGAAPTPESPAGSCAQHCATQPPACDEPPTDVPTCDCPQMIADRHHAAREASAPSDRSLPTGYACACDLRATIRLLQADALATIPDPPAMPLPTHADALYALRTALLL